MEIRIRLVVFDWAGTVVDHGCFAPVAPFVLVLRRNGVQVSVEEARGPMGLDKKEHLRLLLELPHAREQFESAHGRAPAGADIDRMFEDMIPLAIESVREHSHVISGVREVATELRARGIVIGSTTGYFDEAAKVCFARAAEEGFAADAAYCASDVAQARPAPWMLYRNMETLGVYPPASVLKVGDTVPDILEGLNAACWSAGVIASGNAIGLSEREVGALDADERERRFEPVREKLRASGAHATIDTLAELPALIDAIDRRLAAGERPDDPRQARPVASPA